MIDNKCFICTWRTNYDGGAIYLFSDAPPYGSQSSQNNPSPNNGDQFGFWVATAESPTENKVLAGAPFDDTPSSNSGVAFLYSGLPGIGFDQGFLNPNLSLGSEDNFGFSVAIVENPVGVQNLVISAPNNGTAGVVYYLNPVFSTSAKTTITANGQINELVINPASVVPINLEYFVENNGAEDFTIDSISGFFCNPLTYVSGDQGFGDGIVNVGETWKYQCTLPVPTSSIQESIDLQITSGLESFSCLNSEVSCSLIDITLGDPSLLISTASQTPNPTTPGTTTSVEFSVENDGNVDLTDVTLTTTDPRFPLVPNCQSPTVLPPGDGDIGVGESETFSCQTSSLVTVPFIATATGTVPYGGFTTTTLPFTLNVGTYSMDISSSFSPSNPIPPNDIVTVTFSVTNSGVFPITGVSMTTDDDNTGSPNCQNPTLTSGDGTLSFGETEIYQCTTSYSTAQTVILEATVESIELPDQIHLVDPIDIGESSLIISGVFSPPNPIPANSPITVTFTVTNDGDFDLTGTIVESNDPKVTSPNCQNPALISGDGDLSVGESEIYQCTTSSSTSFSLVGSSSATDTFLNTIGPEIEELDLVIGGASISIVGVADENPSPPSGTDVIFTVTNNGTLNLVNIDVTTSHPGDCANPTVIPPGDGNLAPGETENYTCNTGPITGDIVIISTVNAEDEFSNPVTPGTHNLPIAKSAPSVSITGNSSPTSPILQGETPVFDWTVTNNGNVPVDITAFDVLPICENGGPTGPADGEDANSNGLLDLTEIWTFIDCEITINDPPGSVAEVIATVIGSDESGEVSINQQHSTNMVIAEPIVGLSISSLPSNPIINEDTTLNFTVTNTGNVNLDQPILTMLNPFPSTNPIITSCDQSNPILLMPGETFDFTCVVKFTASGPTSVNAQVEISTSDPQLAGIVITDTSTLALQVSEPVSDVTIVSIIRDFKQSHPDMEQGCSGGICTGVKTGLVQNTLGLDGNPFRRFHQMLVPCYS